MVHRVPQTLRRPSGDSLLFAVWHIFTIYDVLLSVRFIRVEINKGPEEYPCDRVLHVKGDITALNVSLTVETKDYSKIFLTNLFLFVCLFFR